ncbi:MAG: cupredoxin domain-containing protein [Actinobacteria bacterium]|nr:cupredoxin domain-containing protein [Actinomycetota bacterium]
MSVRRSTLVAVVIGALALATAVAGCGGGGGSSTAGSTTPTSEGGATSLHIAANAGGALEYNKDELEAPAGKVTITMSNPSNLSHSVAIEGPGVNTAGEVVAHGGTSSVSANLKPGTYHYFCTVPGHREAGMEGTLTVK